MEKQSKPPQTTNRNHYVSQLFVQYWEENITRLLAP
jgi:hypothetical protein